jgi:phosphate transport system substrate-binding protein
MAALLVALGTAVVTVPTASARDTFQRISGSGSSWAFNAIDAMRVNVQQFGITVDYNPTGSSAGRKDFLAGIVDFAASDIPFQFNPEDGSAPENPAPDSYAYIPVVAGGTSFMYNLKINGKRVTNLRLSGENVTKIFTSAITEWNDPAIQADNPGLVLPTKKIVPVVRSDGSGSSAQFTKWMISQYPALWTDYCNRSGRAPKCGFTSFYPTVPGMQSQNGDLGVAGYVAQGFAEGAIGYVNYSYARNLKFPVAKVLNKAGFYTEPTPQNVAVSLLKAKINTNAADPTVYLTQDLEGVYTDADPRNYVLSSYSYFILPTVIAGQFNLEKGKTLGAFANYAMCQAQQQSASLGYSPLPINLVQASFDQIKKIPGAVAQNIDITQCKNPTFSADGTNLLADTAPQPKACDKATFASQCPDGTAGQANVPTAVKAVASGTTGGATGGSTGGTKPKPKPGATGSGPTTTLAPGATVAPGDTTPSGVVILVTDTTVSQVDSNNGNTGNNDSGIAIGAVIPTTIGADTGWNSSLLLILLVVALTIGVVIVPALIWRHYAKRSA